MPMTMIAAAEMCLAVSLILSSCPVCESLVAPSPPSIVRLPIVRRLTPPASRQHRVGTALSMSPEVAKELVIRTWGEVVFFAEDTALSMSPEVVKDMFASTWIRALVFAEDRVIDALDAEGPFGELLENLVLKLGGRAIEIFTLVSGTVLSIAAALVIRMAINLMIKLLLWAVGVNRVKSGSAASDAKSISKVVSGSTTSSRGGGDWRLIRGQGFFLISNPQLDIQAEFPMQGVGMLVRSGGNSPIRRVWADGESYERFSFKTGSALAGHKSKAKTAASQVPVTLGRWEVAKSKAGSIVVQNSVSGEAVMLSEKGMVHIGGTKTISVGGNGQWNEHVSEGGSQGARISKGRRGGGGGFGLKWDEAEEEVDDIPEDLMCPLSKRPMQDPWVAADGFSYERSVIDAWLKDKDTSPMTGETLATKKLIPNNSLRAIISGMKGKVLFD